MRRRRSSELGEQPSVASRNISALPFQDAHEVLLEARPLGGVGQAPGGLPVHDPLGHLGHAGEPGHHHRVRGERAAGRVDVLVALEAEGVAQDQLLVRERGVELGDVELGAERPGLLGGLAGGLLAAVLMYMNPQMLHWTTSGDVIIMTLLGGAGTLWGPVAGVLLFEALKEWLSGWTPYWYGILGLVFILATLYFPQGVLGALQARWSRKRPAVPAPASPPAPAVPLAPREGSPS